MLNGWIKKWAKGMKRREESTIGGALGHPRLEGERKKRAQQGDKK